MTRLKHLAEVRVSNVDKKSYDGERPVRLCNYTDVYYGDALAASRGDFMTATATAAQIANFRLEAGDTVLTKDSETADDIGVSAYIAESAPDFVCGYHLAVLRPNVRMTHPKFLYWAVRGTAVREQLSVAATGVTRFGLRSEALANAALTVPALEEQRRIADFLDDQVALLDRAINLRQHQASLVDERLFTFISDLLAPPARDEGGCTDFPWLANCEDLLVKLGRVCDLRSGLTIDAKREGDTGYPYLRVANVQNGSLDLSEMKSVNVDPALALRCMLRPGDVLMTEGGDLDKLGRGAVWQGEIPNCLHQNHIFALRPHRERLLPEYLAAMTRTHHARRYFEITGNRTTNLASTNSTKILNFRFRLPNLAEQDVLLEQVRKADSAATRAVSLMREQVSLLRERKQAVITAAVTGEFDVTTAKSAA